MTIDSNWDDDNKTIIRNDFGQQWTWAEFVEVCNGAYKRIGDLGSRGDIIANIVGKMPPGNVMGAFRELDAPPKNLGMLVIISPTTSAFWQQLTTIFLKVRPLSYRIIFANSVEEARKLIIKDREKIGSPA